MNSQFFYENSGIKAENLWNTIKTKIKEKGFTQEEVCQQIGYNFGTFKNQMNRNVVPDAIELYKLSQVLNIPMETFITGEDTNGEAKYKKLKTEMLDLLQRN